MKRLIFVLLAFFALAATQETKASHVAGGEIFYEYMGTVNGKPEYCVTVYVYRDNEGTDLGGSIDLTIKSSCSPERTVQAGQLTAGSNGPNGSYIVPTLSECADPSVIDSARFLLHIYKTCVILDGPCADWQFIAKPPCCRNGAITNLTDPGSSTAVFIAKLNNQLRENTSPTFLEPAAKVFCHGRNFVWSQRGIEPDGDSLYYDFGHPLSGPDELADTIPFVSGYSKERPIITKDGNISVNHRTGVFTFTPITPPEQFDVVKVVVEEYHFDTTNLTWYKIGESMREMQIPIIEKCSEEASSGPRINTSAAGFSDSVVSFNFLTGLGLDSIGNDGEFDPTTNQYMYDVPIVEGYRCYDSIVTLVFDNARVQCNTIHPTDFRILGPDTIPRPVVGAVGAGCDGRVYVDSIPIDTTVIPRPGNVFDTVYNYKFTGGAGVDTDTIRLFLERPLDENGDYYVYTKRGNDGNTLQNICGYSVGEFFMIIIRVTDCPPLIYNVENVTVEEDEDIRVDWDIDSSYFAAGAWRVFTGWQVIRRKAGTQEGYYGITDGLIKDIDTRSFVDTNLGKLEVDAESWEYAVQLFQNGYNKRPTAPVSSILLEDSLMTSSTLELSWNAYEGWDQPWYQLYTGSYDTTSETVLAWEAMGPLDTNYYSYNYMLPSNDSLAVSYFAVKVEASGDPDGFVAESNWIYYGRKPIPTPPPPPIVGDPIFPNIFTPNNDGSNDVFYVRTEASDGNEDHPLKDYPKIELSVYNRWGKLVYEDANFAEKNNPSQGWDGTDMNSGQKLADGVYYYTIVMTDPETFREEQHKGAVTILNNGTN